MRVILRRHSSCALIFWDGMNRQDASHPERSGASVTRRAKSKDPAALLERSRKWAGSFDSILVAEAPAIALRMTRVFWEIHGQRRCDRSREARW